MHLERKHTMNMIFFAIIIVAFLFFAIIGFFGYSMICVSKKSLEFDEIQMEKDQKKQKEKKD